MDLLALATGPLGSFVSSFSPGLRNLIDFAREHPDLLRKAIPVVRAAEKEGPAVIDAVRKSAPELIEALKELINMGASRRAPIRAAATDDLAMENALRTMAGVPRVPPDLERAWMDRATPPSDSQFGGG